MASKQKSPFQEAFDSIVFLGFIALLSVAATKANAWEREFCGPKTFVKKVAVKKLATDSKVELSSKQIAY